MVFVAVNALAGVATGPAARVQPLWWALGAAAGTATVLTVLRLVRGETVTAALRGIAGLAVAAGVAAWTGQARDFFLPGIYVDAAYAVGFAGSVLVGRPLVGYLYVALFRRHRDPGGPTPAATPVRPATLGWSAVYGLRVAATST